MSHQFPPDVEQRIRQQMTEGNYESEDELFRAALDALATRNEDLAAIQAGVADMEAGRMRPLTDAADDIRTKYGWTFGGLI